MKPLYTPAPEPSAGPPPHAEPHSEIETDLSAEALLAPVPEPEPLAPADLARLDDPALWAQPLVAGGRELAGRLHAAGHEVYFVGGFVRNALLGQPLKDVDLATSAHPVDIQAALGAGIGVGAHFGVVLVPHAGAHYEIATFRAEGSYVDHRRPSEVRFGTIEEDYRRRDFTINAMYYDPLERRLVDPAGGCDDLAARVLRTVGEPGARFEEDALRLMRAVRFAVRYDLAIDPATEAAIRAHAPTLRAIAIERVTDELVRIMTGPHPGRAMHLMSRLGLWPHVIPEIETMHGVEQPPEYHPEGDVFMHTAMVLDEARRVWLSTQASTRAGESAAGGAAARDHAGEPATAGEMPPELAIAALLHDVGKPPTFMVKDRIRFPEHQRVGAEMARRIAERLRLPRRVADEVEELVEHHMRFSDVRRMKVSTLKQFVTREDFDLHLALHAADCLGSHRKLDNWEFCREERARLTSEETHQAQLPPPLLTGNDLIDLGLRPGPRFGALLEAAREEQLEGRLDTPEQARDWVRDALAGQPEFDSRTRGRTNSGRRRRRRDEDHY